ncbi:MAG: phosphoglucosamine mutase [Actinomycetes bacterium]
MGRLFGTDGVRGCANKDLTPELVFSLGKSASLVIAKQHGKGRASAVVGRDPRASGEMLEAALIAGLATVGVDVLKVGVLPTPAIAYLTQYYKADLGVVLSASHNVFSDNGVKFFSKDGKKLPDEVEDEIEKNLETKVPHPTGSEVGRVKEMADAYEAYLSHLLETVETGALKGLKVVVDCANGAASDVAPDLYQRAGAEVIAIHNAPNGININDNCGSTHMGSLIERVKKEKADLGIAHDGDADRCLAVDELGNIIDGDHILALLAKDFKNSKQLTAETVVSTVMANLGFKLAMKNESISIIETQVGDRYVLEAMEEKNYILGGEQSGHVIMRNYSTTGDGLLTALQLMNVVATEKKSLSSISQIVKKYPQILINVSDVDKSKINNDKLQEAVKKAELSLNQKGRVLLRPSGTESLIRVMVEAETQDIAEKIAKELAEVVKKTC